MDISHVITYHASNICRPEK